MVFAMMRCRWDVTWGLPAGLGYALWSSCITHVLCSGHGPNCVPWYLFNGDSCYLCHGISGKRLHVSYSSASSLMLFCKAANFVGCKSWWRKNVTAISVSLRTNSCQHLGSLQSYPANWDVMMDCFDPVFYCSIWVAIKAIPSIKDPFQTSTTVSHFQKPFNFDYIGNNARLSLRLLLQGQWEVTVL